MSVFSKQFDSFDPFPGVRKLLIEAYRKVFSFIVKYKGVLLVLFLCLLVHLSSDVTAISDRVVILRNKLVSDTSRNDFAVSSVLRWIARANKRRVARSKVN